MKHFINTLTASSLVCASTLMLSGCGGSSSSSTDEGMSLDLPEGLSLSMLNTTTGAYYRFDSTTESRTDLNALAAGSLDSAVNKLAITDTDLADVGYIFHWPDFREVAGEDQQDMKYLVMRSGYQDGTTIDSSEMIQLVHFHGDSLAAHSADEFFEPEASSAKADALERLNSFVDEQIDLEMELEEVMPEGTELCRAYVDPYVKYELAHEAEEEEATEGEAITEEEEHDHGELMHFALDKSGRIHFFMEGEAGLEQAQGFVQLDDVSTIADCSRTTIARVSEDGVLVFIPDTQKLYLVDSHGGDFHQHSTWSVSDLLPEGETTDLVALIGEGEEHDHDHE